MPAARIWIKCRSNSSLLIANTFTNSTCHRCMISLPSLAAMKYGSKLFAYRTPLISMSGPWSINVSSGTKRSMVASIHTPPYLASTLTRSQSANFLLSNFASLVSSSALSRYLDQVSLLKRRTSKSGAYVAHDFVASRTVFGRAEWLCQYDHINLGTAPSTALRPKMHIHTINFIQAAFHILIGGRTYKLGGNIVASFGKS
mmetsp:Transcript_17628/g.40806  ORF Transcript_17628/g.40806 Transcript_17628/m.40806 type:complete len:201 (-) Transcript_17628:38-640(-)